MQLVIVAVNNFGDVELTIAIAKKTIAKHLTVFLLT